MTLILSGTDGLSDVDGSAATPAIRGTDANTGIFFPSADVIAFSEGGVEAMRMDANGDLLAGTTDTSFFSGSNRGVGIYGSNGFIAASRSNALSGLFNRFGSDGDVIQLRRNGTSVGTLDVSTTGITMTGTNGITFTATQTASANANTLDDYEEGTFTPSYTSAGISAVTYGTGRNGYYTKVGRLVTIVVNIMTDAVTVTNGSSFVFITGLPFTAAALTELNSTTGITLTSRFNANPPTGGVIGNNSTQYTLYRTVNTTADDPAQSTVSDFKTGAGNVNTLRFTATYFTAT
jgi:hypothetical protein